MLDQELMARLDAHQRTVLAIIAAAEPFLSDGRGCDDTAALARERWAMVRAMIAYQYFKHAEIFDPAIARQRRGEATQAIRMKRACLALGDEFRAHVTKWSARDVAGEWKDYRPASLRMMSMVRAHIARERSEISLLLAMA